MSDKFPFYHPYRIHKSEDNQFYFTVNAKNGAVLCTSETYKRKQSAIKAIKAIHKAVKDCLYSTPYVDLTVKK